MKLLRYIKPMTKSEKIVYLEAENAHLKKLLRESQVRLINFIPYHQMTILDKNLMVRIDSATE